LKSDLLTNCKKEDPNLNTYIMIKLIYMEKSYMRLQEIERLKKDRNKATYYRERLLKKGKSDKAFKMQKKIDYLDEYIDQLRYAS
jgi:hypothetical protein